MTTAHVSVLNSCQKELRILRARTLNVLIEGPVAATDIILNVLRAEVRKPICDGWFGGFHFPRRDTPTLILRDVSALTSREQKRLRTWLQDEGVSAQVLSTTTVPLFSLVERRLFDRSLYYRLNVFMLRVGTIEPEEGPQPDRAARGPMVTCA